jgi:hypothetical protein
VGVGFRSLCASRPYAVRVARTVTGGGVKSYTYSVVAYPICSMIYGSTGVTHFDQLAEILTGAVGRLPTGGIAADRLRPIVGRHEVRATCPTLITARILPIQRRDARLLLDSMALSHCYSSSAS